MQTVLLEMTVEEAEFLRDLTGYVVGGWAKHANRIHKTLVSVLGEQTPERRLRVGLAHEWTRREVPERRAPPAPTTDMDDYSECTGCVGNCDDCS